MSYAKSLCVSTFGEGACRNRVIERRRKDSASVEQFQIELDLFVWNIDSHVLNLTVDWGCMGGVWCGAWARSDELETWNMMIDGEYVVSQVSFMCAKSAELYRNLTVSI